MSDILIIHGPNLNLLGQREPEVYGSMTLEEINGRIQELCRSKGVSVDIRQSNHEGEIVEMIQRGAGGTRAIVINPAAYTHTSVAIRDALASTGLPVIEVHLSNIHRREAFRQDSYISGIATGVISGLGPEGYLLGVRAAIHLIKMGE